MLSTARRAVGSTALRFLPYSLILLTFADLRAGRHELLLRPTRVLLPTLLTFGCGRAGRRRRRRLLLSQRHGRTDAQCTKRSENFHHLMSPEVAPPAPTRQRACMATVPPIPPADGAIAMLQKKMLRRFPAVFEPVYFAKLGTSRAISRRPAAYRTHIACSTSSSTLPARKKTQTSQAVPLRFGSRIAG